MLQECKLNSKEESEGYIYNMKNDSKQKKELKWYKPVLASYWKK